MEIGRAKDYEITESLRELLVRAMDAKRFRLDHESNCTGIHFVYCAQLPPDSDDDLRCCNKWWCWRVATQNSPDAKRLYTVKIGSHHVWVRKVTLVDRQVEFAFTEHLS